MPTTSPVQTDPLHSICQYFSRAARRYHRHAALQRQIADELAERHLHSVGCESVLELGCGTGFLTRHLAERFPDATIDAVDISADMIDLARHMLPATNIRWQVADMNQLPKQRKYDLVASSTSLHWGEPLEQLVRQVGRWLRPVGKLAAAVMSADTLAELHAIRREVAPHKTPPRRLPTADELADYLTAAGLSVCEISSQTYRQSFPSSLDLLRHLQLTGFTGGPFSHRESETLVRSELAALADRYAKQHAGADGQVDATFQATYVLAELRPARPR